jgi:hypothetical protein
MASLARRALVPAIAVLVLLGAFAGVAVSRGGSPSPAVAPSGQRGGVRFLDHLADELGVSRAELVAAAGRAGHRTIDDLAAADLLTPAQARAARNALQQALVDPGGFKRSLRSWARRLAPYRAVADRLKRSVSSSLAHLLGVSRRELARLVARSELSDAAARAGVSRAEVLSAARRAARRALGPARSRGLVTPTQAAILVRRTVGAVAHHW